MARVVVISPPFASHATPLAALASALAEAGEDVRFACAPEFDGFARRARVAFEPLTVTRNANTGVAETTRQADEDAARLAEFLHATRQGAVAALLAQARHRRADMLADPEGVLRSMRALHQRLRPDWYVVDQLSYPVTLALHCLGARYATYCPGHPTYVLSGPDAYFGVPYAWPDRLRPDPSELLELTAAAQENDRAFTELFDAFVSRNAPTAPAPGRAFALSSPIAVVHAYPELPWLPVPPAGPRRLYAGHMARDTEPLDAHWREQLSRLRRRADRIVLVAFGTFLSARDDVLRTVVEGVLGGAPDTAVVVAAGRRTEALSDLVGDRVVVAESVPQLSLLQHVDAMVHHGGNNSFTECLRAGVPALLLPFSSDQFAVAHDAERAGLGVAADPNRLRSADVASVLDSLGTTVRRRVSACAAVLNERGPRWAASRLTAAMA
ncbi:nucleotide disphospho-sugar-binding domain-containing protein [Streptomyces sp. NPDC001595]|uniref:glycosyltransferase n=1 Tax=Streptomyces sp. NPDC001532 TaxID=3154520 RepID=UPI00331FB8B2